MIVGILTAVGVVGAIGLLIGLFLGAAGLRFHVETDPKEEAVLGLLPGNNCGGCGFAGCSGLAAAIAKGEAPVNACPVGGEAVGEKIAAVMGVEAGESRRMTAFVACQGTCDKEPPMTIPGSRTARCSPLCRGEDQKAAAMAAWVTEAA